jgi:Flp pilus assembly protein protease CpaA
MTAIDHAAGPLPLPDRRPWRLAALAPLLLAGPWWFACRAAGAPQAAALSWLVVALLLATATVTDLLWRRIFNWATYTAAGWAVALQAGGVAELADLPADSPARYLLATLPPGDAVAGLLVGFGLTFLAWLVFQGGAGDVKLVAALGLLLGPSRVLEVIFYGYLFAGCFALGYAIWRAGPLALLTRTPGAAVVLRTRVPMAPFLTAGVIVTLAWSPTP